MASEKLNKRVKDIVISHLDNLTLDQVEKIIPKSDRRKLSRKEESWFQSLLDPKKEASDLNDSANLTD